MDNTRFIDGARSASERTLATSTLEFVAAERVDGYLTAAARLHGSGLRKFLVYATDYDLPLARELQHRIQSELAGATCTLNVLPAGPIAPNSLVPDGDCAFLLEPRAKKLSSLLMQFVDKPISMVAPLTEHHFQRRAIYAVTIPKSGTHMLFELLTALNLVNGGEGGEQLSPAHYYQALGSNSHTQARDFFRTMRKSPGGGGDHPFFNTPTVFLYRNPLDILVSEAFYYQDSSKTALSHYLGSLELEELLLRLISHDPLVLSIRRRIRAYLPWLQLKSVIPVSYEELVGPQGAGSLEEQLKTIWSLQLKLHVPGSPGYYTALLRRESATFRQGRINSHLEHFSARCRAAFAKLNQDFMHALGYDMNDAFGPGYVSRRVEQYRHRPLVLGEQRRALRRPDVSRPQPEPERDAVYACLGYLATSAENLHFALPASAPRPVDPRLASAAVHVHVASSWNALLEKLAADPLSQLDPTPRAVPDMRRQDIFRRDISPPILAAADVCGFNVVEFDGLFYCLEIKRGRVDVQFDDMTDVFRAPTLDAAREHCQSQAPAVEET